jgi:hypothetical protein
LLLFLSSLLSKQKYDVEIDSATRLRELDDILYSFSRDVPALIAKFAAEAGSDGAALAAEAAGEVDLALDEKTKNRQTSSGGSLYDSAFADLLPECSYFDDTLALYLKCRISGAFKSLLVELHTRLKALPWMTFSKKHPVSLQGDAHFGDETESLYPVATLVLGAPEGIVTRDNAKDVVSFVRDFIAAEAARGHDTQFRVSFDHIALCPLEDGKRLVSKVIYFPVQQQRQQQPSADAGETAETQPPAEKWMCASHVLSIPDLTAVTGDLTGVATDPAKAEDSREVVPDADISLAEVLPLPGLPHTAIAYRSTHVDDLIAVGLRRAVEGLEGFENNTFGSIFNFILQYPEKYRAYVYGGFIRDAFTTGTLSDDVDSLFTSPVSRLVPDFEMHGWPYFCKRDEATNAVRDDFVAVGTGKGRFSGHILGSGCEGEFSMNTLVYDIESRVLVDPFGTGIDDAMNHILRIASHDWRGWLDGDRVVGMRLLRFANFRARGYKHADQATRVFMMENLRALAEGATAVPAPTPAGAKFARTVRIFFARKIFVDNRDAAARKESDFRHQVIHDYSKVFGAGSGEAFFEKHMRPLYPERENE